MLFRYFFIGQVILILFLVSTFAGPKEDLLEDARFYIARRKGYYEKLLSHPILASGNIRQKSDFLMVQFLLPRGIQKRRDTGEIVASYPKLSSLEQNLFVNLMVAQIEKYKEAYDSILSYEQVLEKESSKFISSGRKQIADIVETYLKSDNTSDNYKRYYSHLSQYVGSSKLSESTDLSLRRIYSQLKYIQKSSMYFENSIRILNKKLFKSFEQTAIEPIIQIFEAEAINVLPANVRKVANSLICEDENKKPLAFSNQFLKSLAEETQNSLSEFYRMLTFIDEQDINANIYGRAMVLSEEYFRVSDLTKGLITRFTEEHSRLFAYLTSGIRSNAQNELITRRAKVLERVNAHEFMLTLALIFEGIRNEIGDLKIELDLQLDSYASSIEQRLNELSVDPNEERNRIEAIEAMLLLSRSKEIDTIKVEENAALEVSGYGIDSQDGETELIVSEPAEEGNVEGFPTTAQDFYEEFEKIRAKNKLSREQSGRSSSSQIELTFEEKVARAFIEEPEGYKILLHLFDTERANKFRYRDLESLVSKLKEFDVNASVTRTSSGHYKLKLAQEPLRLFSVLHGGEFTLPALLDVRKTFESAGISITAVDGWIEEYQNSVSTSNVKSKSEN